MTRTTTAIRPQTVIRPQTLIRRRLAAVVACAAVAAAPLVSAPPASAAPSSTAGLFGEADPTYDGVYRQSMALLGLSAAKAAVPATAIGWLTAQQCSDGSFQAYRADLSVPCAAPDPDAFTGPDSNSTALAATALRAVGRAAAADRAVTALRSRQNADGGWGYTLGGASDVNSTGLVLAALRGAPRSSATTSAVSRAMRYLRSVQAPCSSPVASRFGLPYQAGGPVNALASVQALVGISTSLPVPIIARTPLVDVRCDDPFIERVAAYVNRQLMSTGGAIPSALGDGTDWNATAFAVLGLAAAGASPEGIATGVRSLGRNTTAFVGSGASVSPAAAGTLIQVAAVTGAKPRSFGTGRTNLVSLLLGTLQDR